MLTILLDDLLRLKGWVAVKLDLSYHIGETLLTTIYIYLYIYIHPMWRLYLSSLTATQKESHVQMHTSLSDLQSEA